MQSRGIVKSDGSPCKVAVVRQSACGENCASCGGCALSNTVVIADNSIGAKAGDRVVLEIPDKTAISAAKAVYLFPILMLFVSLAIGYFSGLSENGVIVIALISLAVSFFATRAYSKIRSERFTVKIVEVLM